MQGAICMAKLKASGRAEVSEHQHRLEPGECKALLLKLEFMADPSPPASMGCIRERLPLSFHTFGMTASHWSCFQDSLDSEKGRRKVQWGEAEGIPCPAPCSEEL